MSCFNAPFQRVRADVATEAKSPETKVVCHAIDFSSAKASDYANFERVLAPLDVGILGVCCLHRESAPH